MDNYEHFFVTCNKIQNFWHQFSIYVDYLKKIDNFEITLRKIICGWNIDSSIYDFVNVLIQLATFAIYKSKMIYNETKKYVLPKIHFMHEINNLYEMIDNSSRKIKQKVDLNDLYNCKIYWNIK